LERRGKEGQGKGKKKRKNGKQGEGQGKIREENEERDWEILGSVICVPVSVCWTHG